MGGQQVQDPVFCGRQGYLLPILAHQALIRVDLNISAAPHHAGGGLGAIDAVAPQHGLDPGDQLRIGEGLDQIIVAPYGEAHGLVGILGLGREKQHRYRRLLAYLGAGGVAAGAGHHYIQNHQVYVV